LFSVRVFGQDLIRTGYGISAFFLNLAGDMGKMAANSAQPRARQGAARDESLEIKEIIIREVY
jgi:hypothetical protein